MRPVYNQHCHTQAILYVYAFVQGSVNVVPVLGSSTELETESTSHTRAGLIGGVPPYKKIQTLRKFILDFRLGESFIYR
jgi:hypothetical protein